jgi:hypothetical protein
MKEVSRRFAFDVDGMILEMPELFAVITAALRSAGHRIYLVTDFDERYRHFREEEMRKIGISYDELIITSAKERFFRENKIDFALDDDPEYYGTLQRLQLFAFAPHENAD